MLQKLVNISYLILCYLALNAEGLMDINQMEEILSLLLIEVCSILN